MAEALLKKTLENTALSECYISSAGIAAMVGSSAEESARQLMSDQGIDITSHKARALSKVMVQQADLVLVMESAHKTIIEEKVPSARGKVFKLGQWGNFDIPDPYKKEHSAYQSSLNLIETGIMQWKQKLVTQL